MPRPADYEAFFRDRDARLTEAIVHEGKELLQAARDRPGEEQTATLGVLGVGVTVEVVETLEEVFLAVKAGPLTEETLNMLFAVFFPDKDFEEISSAAALPSRSLNEDELGFRCLLP